jgi:glycosyltransferase involved in cell wall biosynthesis
MRPVNTDGAVEEPFIGRFTAKNSKKAITKRGHRSFSLEKIDVTVATKNSAKTIERCLQSIRENVPVKRLVVVDTESIDGTREVAKRYGALVVDEPGKLGRVRLTQANYCETKWIAFVDSDIYVYPSWWHEVSKFASPGVGMVSGFADARINKLPIYDVYLKYLARRQGTVAFSNTLVMRELIIECAKSLQAVHAGEDDIVARHIRSKGLSIVTIPKRLCLHDKDPVGAHPRDYFRAGQSLRIRWGQWGLVVCMFSLRTAVTNWLHFSVDSRRASARLLGFLIVLWLWMLAGFMSMRNSAHK